MLSIMKVGKQIKVISYYSPEAVEQLAKLCEITRVRKAEYLREALDDLLKKYAGTLRSGATKSKRSTG